MAEVAYWVAFNMVPGIGPIKFKRLLDHFGSAELAWQGSRGELERAGLDSKASEAIVDARSRLDLDREMERLCRQRIEVITWEHPLYPQRLANIYNPPPVLYVKGQLTAEDELAIAVVGTRRATAYGRVSTEQIVGDLARNKVTVVSGLAKGIDSYAHRACLDAGGRTVAVLGSGLDTIYPAENSKLAQAIAEQGALISEFPLGIKPEPGYFPYRNRIISGLAIATLIVEAGEGSGALITADYALEQGRDVFAVPGNITARTSRGTNRLIQEGAKLVMDAQDILEELNLTMAGQQLVMKELLPADQTEGVILQALSREPIHIDELKRATGLPMAAVSSALTVMELKGMVRQVGGMNYVAAHESRSDYNTAG